MSIRTGVESSWNSADQDIVKVVCNGASNQSWPQDVRCQWPVRVFERVCICEAGWGGYDCSQCDFGYIANGAGGCVKRSSSQLLERRNFKDLTNQERSDYFRVVKEAKNEKVKKWAVVVSEPNDASGSFTLLDVSTYDMLVMHHFLATRETDNKACGGILERDLMGKNIDFAHNNSTFLTWHRYYLLIVEREFRRIAESLNIRNFTLAYWDWTTTGSSQIFTQAIFGEPKYSNKQVNVAGNLFGNDWPVLCDKHYQAYLNDNGKGDGINRSCATVRELCNISAERASKKSLQRGRISDKKPFLPDDGSIKMALTATSYDGDYGFNQRAEGFVELCTRVGMTPNVTQCRFLILRPPSDVTHNNLHNAVHIYLGGHMRDVPTASNDPVFFLHHANIDRIFEAWLRKFNGNLPDYMPTSDRKHPGHNRNDYLVPFFPLKTNADMYKKSSDLGFEYDSLPWKITIADSDSLDPCPFVLKANTDDCGKGGTPGAGSSNFHVPLHLILIAGTCAVLIASKLSNI